QKQPCDDTKGSWRESHPSSAIKTFCDTRQGVIFSRIISAPQQRGICLETPPAFWSRITKTWGTQLTGQGFGHSRRKRIRKKGAKKKEKKAGTGTGEN